MADQVVTVEPYEDELTALRRTLEEVKAPDDRLEGTKPTSLHRLIRLLANQRDQFRQELEEVEKALNFGFKEGTLPERIQRLCGMVRGLMAERDDLEVKLRKLQDRERERQQPSPVRRDVPDEEDYFRKLFHDR